MQGKQFGNCIEAYGLKPKFNELWQMMVTIEARHADRNTPWRDAEIKLVVDKSRNLLARLPITPYTKENRQLALKILKQIEDGDADWYRLNNLRDAIHNIWSYGLPNAPQITTMEAMEKKGIYGSIEDWEKDKYKNFTSPKQFTVKTCPSRGNRNFKEQSDKGMIQRFHFFHNFVQVHGGSALADRFWTVLHDIAETSRNTRTPLWDIQDAIKAFEKALISREWFLSFTKKCLKESISESLDGPDTWNRDREAHKIILEFGIIRDLLKHDTPDVHCDTTNCQTRHTFTKGEMKKLQEGKGAKFWWCKKHNAKRPDSI